MNQVNDGTRKITHAHFPSCFYDVAMYSPRNKKLGFMRGEGIVRASHLIYYTVIPFTNTFSKTFRHLFTSPSSALNPALRRGNRTPQGLIHKLMAPTPRTIAYVAIQVWVLWIMYITDSIFSTTLRSVQLKHGHPLLALSTCISCGKRSFKFLSRILNTRGRSRLFSGGKGSSPLKLIATFSYIFTAVKSSPGSHLHRQAKAPDGNLRRRLGWLWIRRWHHNIFDLTHTEHPSRWTRQSRAHPWWCQRVTILLMMNLTPFILAYHCSYPAWWSMVHTHCRLLFLLMAMPSTWDFGHSRAFQRRSCGESRRLCYWTRPLQVIPRHQVALFPLYLFTVPWHIVATTVMVLIHSSFPPFSLMRVSWDFSSWRQVCKYRSYCLSHSPPLVYPCQSSVSTDGPSELSRTRARVGWPICWREWWWW